ncbi:MAG: DNA-binding protein WhiA [Gaiellales bacterium]
MSGGELVESARAELAAITPATRCDRLAQVSALFHTAGTAHLLGRGRVSFHLDLAESAIARSAFSVIRALRVEAEIRTYRQRAFSGATRYQLLVPGSLETIAVLAEAGVVDPAGVPLERPPGRVVAKSCCRAAYARGAFLGGGSLSGPRSPHLEIRTPGHAGAAFLRAVASASSVRLKVVDRVGSSAAYAKSWEAIEGFLSLAGATDTVLQLEERALVADLRGDANRLANADHANLVRQSRASQRQLDAAHALRDAGALERAPRALQEAAALRLRHPALSLAELARRAEPPVSKAAMAGRLTRLVELAELP